METRRFSLPSGILAIVALLSATNVSAQSSCTSKTTGEAAGNFVVSVSQQAQNGRRTYTYTVSNAPGKNGNPNKFFVFVTKGLNLVPGDLVAKNITANTLGSYQTPDTIVGNNPPAAAWNVVHHEDGIGFTNIAINAVLQLDVSERYKPEESVTTVLLSISNTFEHCGPIYGPTTPAPPEFQGSPLITTVSRKTFENGCVYDVTSGATDNIVNAMVAVTPFGTNPPTEACTVQTTPNICATDLGLAFCPPGELGRPPLQSVSGGTCYYPPNLKFTC